MPVFECARCNELTYSASVDSAQPCPCCAETRHRVLDGGFASARELPRDLSPGDHATLVYEDPESVAPFCARYITDGLEKGERVLAVSPRDLRAAIGRRLPPGAEDQVEWPDPLAIYGDFDSDRVAAMYEALIDAEPRCMRILAVFTQLCAAGVEPAEWDRYECRAHEIVARYGATALCTYDIRGLAPEFLETAHRRHGLAVQEGSPRRNELFEYQPA